MKVAGDWLEAAPTQAVCAMLDGAGHQALLVGGCVRNALLGAPVNDIDISTDARPEQVIALARRAGLNAIPTGIEHGTVTVVADHIGHEITTFRRDVDTDGRRAVVAYADTVEQDARRRDFTMNALYARADGEVIDPLGGLEDLQQRRVRFIDDARQRIREDYLRILRYFRFHAWYGDLDAGMDVEALAAIAAHTDGLASLSRERVGGEMRKLLAASNPAPAVAAMRSTGVLAAILSGAEDRGLAPLVHLEELLGARADAMRRLAVLGGQDVAQALRLSKKHSKVLAQLRAGLESSAPAGELGYVLGQHLGLSVLLLRAAVFEMPLAAPALSELRMGAKAVFPVTPSDLMPRLSGADLGAALRMLEQRWIASGFVLGRDALILSLGN